MDGYERWKGGKKGWDCNDSSAGDGTGWGFRVLERGVFVGEVDLRFLTMDEEGGLPSSTMSPSATAARPLETTTTRSVMTSSSAPAPLS